MTIPRIRIAALGVTLCALVAACGNDPLTVSEYAKQTEQLVAAMQTDFVSIDTTWESDEPTPDRAIIYWDGRLAIRTRFLDAIKEMRPPPEVVSMHDNAVAVFEKITAADVALAERVATMGPLDEHWQWEETEEGAAAAAVLAEVYDFCRSSQDEFDNTADRAALEGVPWLPPDMQEVIKVAFGCPPSAP